MGKSLKGKDLGKGFTQRKDGMYQGTYYENGKRKYLYDRNFRKLKDKIKRAKEIAEEYGKDFLCQYDREKVTFDKMYNDWHDNRLIHKNLKEASIYQYECSYRRTLKNGIGNLQIINMNKVFCERYLNNQKNISCYSRARTIMHQVFDYAKDSGIININPIEGIPVKKWKKKDSEHLTKEDQTIILDNENNPIYHNYISFAIYTGMRCSEICGLELKNIDLEHSSIKIEKQLCYEVDRNTGKNKYIFKDLKTESSKRTIFITGKAKEAIEKQMNIREKYKSNEEDFSDLLFYSNSGTPLHVNMIDAHLNRVYNRLKDDLSVSRLSCHMFRHTFATYCLELGIHPRVIQEALGHKYDRITQIYAQVTETMKASSLSKLDNLYDIK